MFIHGQIISLQYDHSEYYEMFLSKTKAHDLYRNLNFSDTFN